jgi:hypothetical protein
MKLIRSNNKQHHHTIDVTNDTEQFYAQKKEWEERVNSGLSTVLNWEEWKNKIQMEEGW